MIINPIIQIKIYNHNKTINKKTQWEYEKEIEIIKSLISYFSYSLSFYYLFIPILPSNANYLSGRA